MNDDELLDALGDALQAPDRPVPPGGLADVRARAAASGDRPPAAGSSRRNVLVGSVAAAIGVAVGIAGTAAVTSSDSKDEASGPPTRPVEFATVPTGATVAGRTIGHTWGMELLLDVSGLPVGRAYAVAYDTTAGPVPAGGFRSVDVPMACRFNGTVLRDDVAEITITDESTGEVVLRGRPV